MRKGSGLIAPFSSNQILRYASVFKFTSIMCVPKLQILCEENPKIREGIESGEYLLGTTDVWIVWRFTSGYTFPFFLSPFIRLPMKFLKGIREGLSLGLL